MKPYHYIIIKHNYKELSQETVLLDNKYSPTKKYAYIEKQVYKDGSESINRIIYSNDLEKFQKDAKNYPSWYNYPLGICKSMQGYLSEIN